VLNPIQSVSQVFGVLGSTKNLKVGTINFKKIVDAYVSGKHGIVEILENPVALAGIAPQQAHHFKKFLESNQLPKKLRRIKTERIIVAQADLDTIDDNLMSTRNYSDFGMVGEDQISGYTEISSSYAMEMLAPLFNDAPQTVTTKKILN